MSRPFQIASLACLSLALAGSQASAQYAYPPGYGGWGGWGATTAAGSTGAGMGMFAAGKGQYNVDTAQARSINANTAMQFNDYMWKNQQVRNQQYYAQLAERQQTVNETAATTYKRLHDQPEAADINRGDALNVVYDEITQPSVYAQTMDSAKAKIPGSLVANIPFQYAPAGVTIALDSLSADGVPDVLLTNPAFEADRKAIRPLVQAIKKQAHSDQDIDPALLAQLREAIKKARSTVAATLQQGTPERTQADNWLKAFFGLTKMLQKPAIENYLKDLKTDQTTTVAQLLNFMQSFDLRFGVAKTPDQQAAYRSLYPALLRLRNQLNPPSISPVADVVSPPPAKHAVEFFSGMDMSHVDPDGTQHIQVPTRN